MRVSNVKKKEGTKTERIARTKLRGGGTAKLQNIILHCGSGQVRNVHQVPSLHVRNVWRPLTAMPACNVRHDTNLNGGPIQQHSCCFCTAALSGEPFI